MMIFITSFLFYHTYYFLPSSTCYHFCFISGCSVQVDAVFVIDVSGSIETLFELQLKLAKYIVQGLDFSFGRAKVGVVLFHQTASVCIDIFVLLTGLFSTFRYCFYHYYYCLYYVCYYH